jgi:hypothetical protein
LNSYTTFRAPRLRYKNNRIINVKKTNNVRNNEMMRYVPATIVAGDKQ